MQTYHFKSKLSEEPIKAHTANSYEEAVSFFAALKQLSVDVFLQLYHVTTA